MNDLEFFFGESLWETLLEGKVPGEAVSAVELLTVLEGESEEEAEACFSCMEANGLLLDISGLPKASGTGEAALRLRQEQQLIQKGLSPELLEPGDPLRLYLEEVAQTPACGDEQLLAEKCAEGDESAMVMLTNLGLSRVIALAQEFTGYGVLLLDLIQEGSLGLWQAVREYENGSYEQLSRRRIRFYLSKAVVLQARANGVGQRMRTALEDYRAVDERLLSELGRNATLEEIAEQLHMTPGETEAVKKTLDNARILAQAKKVPEPEEEAAAEEEDQAVENTALFQMRQRIQDLLSELEERDAKLLTLRFGLEGGLPLSPEEAGRKLGLTSQEVVAREAAALAKLRNV